MPINTFRGHLTSFPSVKSFTFFTLELVYKVGGFAVGKGGDGISKAGVGTGERLGGDVEAFQHPLSRPIHLAHLPLHSHVSGRRFTLFLSRIEF